MAGGNSVLLFGFYDLRIQVMLLHSGTIVIFIAYIGWVEMGESWFHKVEHLKGENGAEPVDIG